jgi:hypothetical protein
MAIINKKISETEYKPIGDTQDVEERFCIYCGAKESEKGQLTYRNSGKNRRLKRGYCAACNKRRTTGTLEVRLRAPLGKYSKRLRQVLKNMCNRCYNPKNIGYKDYGGRGISVCEKWRQGNSSAFCDWALSHGYENGLEIDRIDVNGNYEPDNCRFVPRIVNANNKQNTSQNPGVYKERNQWRACMHYKRIRVLDMHFHSKEDAINVRKQTEIKYLGGIL